MTTPPSRFLILAANLIALSEKDSQLWQTIWEYEHERGRLKEEMKLIISQLEKEIKND